jgi:hypothetical protein
MQKQQLAQLQRQLEVVTLARSAQATPSLTTSAADESSIASRIAPPPYFTGYTDDVGSIKDDYNCPGGVNCCNAELMLNYSVFSNCECLRTPSSFEIVSFRRIESRVLWERFKLREDQAARNLAALSPTARAVSLDKVPRAHPWLQRLEASNGLPLQSNTRYLLHGTQTENLESIVQNGLAAKLAPRAVKFYGTGIYFARHSCKACQYTDGNLEPDNGLRTIIICRVALGRIESLKEACKDRNFANPAFDSAMAVSGETLVAPNQPQLHNEFIVYEDSACYPEFILQFRVLKDETDDEETDDEETDDES